MKKQREHYTPQLKVAILRRHLVEGLSISDLGDDPWRPSIEMTQKTLFPGKCEVAFCLRCLRQG
jgi:hypothetical protein